MCIKSGNKKAGVVIILVGLILGVVLNFFTYQQGFKQGQITAQIGRVQYKLMPNYDGSTEWKKVHE